MKRLLKILIVLLSTLYIVGCNSLLTSPIGKIPAPTQNTSDNSSELQTTSTILQDNIHNKVVDVCPLIENNQKGDFVGSVILYDSDQSRIVNLEGGSTIEIGTPEDKYYYYTISPDQKWFFANGWREVNNQYSKLNILSDSNGVLINVADISTESIQWLNDDNIYTITYDENVFPKALNILSLNGSTERVISLDFFSELLNPKINRWVISPNSNGDYVIYPDIYISQVDFVKEQVVGFSLYDIQAKKVVNSLRTSSLISSEVKPKWTIDGSKVYLATSGDGESHHDEIYSMDTNGNIERLTYFIDDHSYVNIRGLNLSPKEDKLAFWISINPVKPLEEYLVVLDINSKQMARYCVRGNIDSTGSACFMGEPPFWAPDDNHVILTSCIAPNDDEGIHTKVIIVDLQNNKQIILSDNKIVKGWLINTPLK